MESRGEWVLDATRWSDEVIVTIITQEHVSPGRRASRSLTVLVKEGVRRAEWRIALEKSLRRSHTNPIEVVLVAQTVIKQDWNSR
jgi:hypothetical protein